MFTNYLKIALRNISKHKGYTFINIFGFAIGITCCLLITLFLLDELSYDKFYPNSDRIYRVVNYGVVNNRIDHTARSSPPLAKVLATEFPEVEAVTQCRNYGFPVFRYKNKVFSEERVFNVDQTFFDVFKIKFIQGNPKTALDQPDKIVLTLSMAEKYFGNEDPMGKIINADKRRDYIVAAVVEDVPGNSHFHYDFLRSLENANGVNSPVWVFNDFYTYVLLKEKTNTDQIEAKLFEVVKERINPFMQQVLGISVDQFLDGGGDFRYYFQPLTDIHLYSHLDFEIEPNGDISYVYIFLTIAAGILLIACINFVNLATARSAVRGREIGIRKTVGSNRTQLLFQFLIETVILTILAMTISWILADLVLPIFNQITDKNLTLPLFSHWYVIPLAYVFAIFIGITAGFYPALLLASFKPVKVLTGDQLQTSRGSNLRTSLVVFQFAISIILIIATFSVHQQLDFIQNTDLGFNKDQVVIIHKTDDLGRNLNAFKEKLLSDHNILFVSNSVDLIGNHIEVAAVTPEGQEENKAKMICYMTVDPDFLDTYGITLKEGRFFDKDPTVNQNKMVLNEAAIKVMGLKDAIGKRLNNSLFPQNRYSILGIVKDFHFQSLRQRIQPMVFAPFTKNQVGKYLSVRIRPENINETINYMSDSWQKFANGQIFEYEFFDDHFERIFLAEKSTEFIFLIFAIIAIIIACLGLFGLSSFITERRTKEVGVRKVLGSSTGRITFLLIREFLKWILIANIIAWPIAWFFMNNWLQNFAYRISVGWEVFLIAGCIALMIAIITVGTQAIKAATANPINSLRYE